MKKNNFILCLSSMMLFLLFAVSSCTNKEGKDGAVDQQARKDIEKELAAFNKQLPMEIPNMGQITSVGVEDNNVTYKYLITFPFKVNTFNEHQSMMKSNAVSGILNIPNGKTVLDQIKKAGMGLKLVMTGGTDHGRAEINISHQELVEIANHPLSDKQQLDNLVELTKLQLPMLVDEMTACTDVYLNSEAMVYIYEVADNNNEVAYLEALGDVVVNNLMQSLKNSASYNLVKLLIKNNKVLRYSYKGTVTGQTATVNIPVEKLRQIIYKKSK